MLLAVTITTKQRQQLTKRWKLEGGTPPVPGQRNFQGSHHAQPGAPPPTFPPPGTPVPESQVHWLKEDYKLPPPGVIAPSLTKDPNFAGAMVVYDYEARKPIWSSDWGNNLITPQGLCFADGVMYISDIEAAHVFKVSIKEPGKLLERISNPAFNDTHTVWRTSRGLLTANSGTDSLIEVALDGSSLWEWWGAEHGFDMSVCSLKRTSGRGQEQRNQYYHTRFQATHLNNGVTAGPNDRFVLSTFFHQGMLVRIDRSRPEREQVAEVVQAGLARPHGPMPLGDGGWIVANSLGKELLLFDEALHLTRRVDYDGGWIQDTTRLSNGNILINDVDFFRFVELAGPDWHEVARWEYDPNWRVAEVREVPKVHEESFRRAGSPKA